jgi:hypothetical protein
MSPNIRSLLVLLALASPFELSAQTIPTGDPSVSVATIEGPKVNPSGPLVAAVGRTIPYGRSAKARRHSVGVDVGLAIRSYQDRANVRDAGKSMLYSAAWEEQLPQIYTTHVESPSDLRESSFVENCFACARTPSRYFASTILSYSLDARTPVSPLTELRGDVSYSKLMLTASALRTSIADGRTDSSSNGSSLIFR